MRDLNIRQHLTIWISMLILGLTLLIILSLWLTLNINLTTWGNTKITSRNFLEATYLTKKDIFWQKTYEKISEIKNKNAQEKLLETYLFFIPVTQWWNPLYPQYSQAHKLLSDIYISKNKWSSLKKINEKFIEVDPRKAAGFYLIGLSEENMGNWEKAVNNYFQSLSIESTHEESLFRLTNLLQKMGHPDYAQEVINSYLNVISTGKNEFCFYYGLNSFSSEQKECINSAMNKEVLLVIDKSEIKTPKINMIRFDIPKNRVVDLTNISFVSKDGEEKNIPIDLDFFLLHQAKKLNKTSFAASGADAYVYKSIKTINLENMTQIKIKFKMNLLVENRLKELAGRS